MLPARSAGDRGHKNESQVDSLFIVTGSYFLPASLYSAAI